MSKLVIVESPTKAKTIQRFLGKDYVVTSSQGHIRDLPKSKIGVNVEKNFEATYEIPEKAKKKVQELKQLAKETEDIYFATDPDREGEAIAWHLAELLKVDPKVSKRISFHEITDAAIREAFEHPESINMNLVNAQQARRVLDRLVGYELSPLLWKKIYYGLSAGRVQSVAVKLVVDREEEIRKFNSEEYWSLHGIFETKTQQQEIDAELVVANGEKLEKMSIKNAETAQKLYEAAQGKQYSLKEIIKKESQKKSPAPFTTSTLQQEANKKLGYSAKQTMMIAQKLYEGIKVQRGETKGIITYMRTDSTTLSETFISDACAYIEKEFGKNYNSGGIRYASKSKNAQEAHEAVRPTDVNLDPERLKDYLEEKEFKLYELIWKRAVASQMLPARMQATSYQISEATNQFIFRASGSVIIFDGYLKVYRDSVTEKELPQVQEGEALHLKDLRQEQHFTEAPGRYTEASLIKKMEELGIGRPSTYAPTISTIVTRKYVLKDGKAIKPTETGELVNKLLVNHFKDIVDFEFTANMEQKLDDVSNGNVEWHQLLKEFYAPFKENILLKDKEIDKKEFSEQITDHICKTCGKNMIMKFGKFGKFLACSGYPECTFTQEIGEDGNPEAEEKIEEKCPSCAADMEVKRGRFGKFIACSRYPECKTILKKEIKTGIACNVCKEGEFIEKKSRFGKIFYSCNRYPECKTALWAKPNGDICKLCSALLVVDDKERIRCSNKECVDYKIKKEEKKV